MMEFYHLSVCEDALSKKTNKQTLPFSFYYILCIYTKHFYYFLYEVCIMFTCKISHHTVCESTYFTCGKFTHVHRWFSHMNCNFFFFESLAFTLSPPLIFLQSFSLLHLLNVLHERQREEPGRQRVCAYNYVHVRDCAFVRVCVLVKVCVREREGRRRFAQREERDLVDLSGCLMSHFCPQDLTSVSLSGK